MALFDNGLKLGTGLAIGIGTVILAPVIIPVITGVAKPLVKEIIKGGLVLVEKSRVMAAEAKEALEDITAEAQAELSEQRQQSFEAPGQEIPEVQPT
jgi:hypothetical protein